jgi:hypothetical protein
MTLPELDAELAASGVRLSLRLVVDAPRGALDETLRTALAELKPMLVHRLAREALWAELADWRWGPRADDPTPGIVRD